MFTEKEGRPVTQDRAQWAFERAVLKSGIDTANRKIVCHSLRYRKLLGGIYHSHHNAKPCQHEAQNPPPSGWQCP